MELKIETRDGVSVITVEGKLDGNTSAQAQEKIMPLVLPGARLVMDMSRCDYVSSAGLRVLLLVAKQTASRGGKVALAGVGDEVKDVMEMTGFGGFFKNHPSADEAVRALKAG
ncbi:MAG TPA: STAS domain-containing protein [Elusimicrobiota bacterium]|nr:STAS domain-containing protein [Elusimicrobiota bacterium]